MVIGEVAPAGALSEQAQRASAHDDVQKYNNLVGAGGQADHPGAANKPNYFSPWKMKMPIGGDMPPPAGAENSAELRWNRKSISIFGHFTCFMSFSQFCRNVNIVFNCCT